jgi:hypothetical protein
VDVALGLGGEERAIDRRAIGVEPPKDPAMIETVTMLTPTSTTTAATLRRR